MCVPPLIKRFFSRSHTSESQWEAIDRITCLFESSADVKAALDSTAREICSALEAARCSILLLDETITKGEYCLLDIDSLSKNDLSRFDAEAMNRLMTDSQSLEISDLESSEMFRESAQAGLFKSLIAAPIRVDTGVRGTLIVQFRKSESLHDQTRLLVRAAASTIGIEIQRTILRDKAHEIADREAIRNEMLEAIRTAVGIDEILRAAVESLGTRLGLRRAVIYLHDISQGEAEARSFASGLTARAEYYEGGIRSSLIGREFKLEDAGIREKLLRGEIIIPLQETGDSPHFHAFAPIAYNGRTAGLLGVEHAEESREMSPEDLRLMRLVAEQTAVAMYQADLYREVYEAARREALISKITSALHRSLDPESVLKAIVNELGAALSVCRCRLALFPEPLPDEIDISHQYIAPCCLDRSPAMQRVPVSGNAHLQEVLSSDAPVATRDIAADERLAPYYDQLESAGVKSMLTASIRLAGRPIGFFALHHCERYHLWTQWEIDLVKAVARQAAVAIRQAQLYREARDSATESALINEIVAAIRHSLDLGTTLQVAVEELGRTLGASRTYFRQLIGENKAVLAEYVSHPTLSIKGLPVNIKGYLFRALEESRRTMIIDDVSRFIAEHPEEGGSVSIWKIKDRNLSQIICPIFVNGELFGGVVIGQTDYARKWTSSEIALIEAVTAQMEVAVSHSQLFEEAKQSARREALISHLTYKINQSNRLDEIFPVVAHELGEHLATDRLTIIQFNHQSQTMTIECEYKNGEIVKPNLSYDMGRLSGMRAFLDNGLIVSDDVERDPRVKPFLDETPHQIGTQALMVAPLYYKGTPRFAIAAIMTREPRVWREEEKDLLREAAEQVFTAFERAALFEQVSHGKFEWESTFDALTDGIFIFDQNGTLRRVNAAAAAFEGAAINSLLGRQCCTLLQGIETDHCRVAQVIETGRPVTFELVPERLNRPVLVTISPLTTMIADREDGKPMGAVCIVRDLSELRAAEAIAREQRNFLVKLIEHATDSIFALSPDGRFIWFNEQLTGLSGYSRDELKEGNYQRFLPAREKLKVTRRFLRALKGEAQTFEMQALSKMGEQRLLLVTYTPIYDEGRITSVLSIARDVTEERLASERAAQADKLRALGQLASGVAHNFNNILAAILGHTQLMKRDCRDDHSLERLDIIERAAIDGAETVKRIQGFGLHQEGAIAELIDVNQLVHDSTTLTQARWRDDAQAHSLRYEVEVDLHSVPLVRGSASELREVFVNIILNALDAMPGGGRLKISTEASASSVQIGFADTGKGMSREVREHIFEPFFTTKGADGMGLGLAVSYSIVERHGGRIEVASEQGHGSIFIITLPAARNVRAESRRRHKLTIKSANILVIDDDRRVREAMAGMLDAAGHRTHQASTGREGLTLMEQRGFDIVFTDLSMPETDGWAVANEIRRRWPDVKIVLMTGYAVSPETIDHQHHLVDHVIIKPVRFEDIDSALCKVTNDH